MKTRTSACRCSHWGRSSCFIRHEDGTVTCPVGRQLFRKKDSQVRNRLLQPGGLPNLPQSLHRFEETEARQHRPQQRLRACRHVRRPALPAPADSGRNPELAAQQFRKIKARRKARHGVHPAGHSQSRSSGQQTSEHPFGTIKHCDDSRHFLCRGKEKVTAEFALSALSYNIRRAIALCGGVQKLIERYRRIAMPKVEKSRKSEEETPPFFAISGSGMGDFCVNDIKYPSENCVFGRTVVEHRDSNP